jgi:Zn-dependent protease with chaperone function/type II secretory pathway pseudopilin PulG
MALDAQLRSPKEQQLFVLGVVLSSVVWLLLIVSIVGVFYGLIGVAFALIAHALFLANIKGNGVRVSPRQFPDLYESCRKSARTLGVTDAPEVYLIQAGGSLNAFATKLLSRKFMIVFSDLADECQDPRQLEFVIGHEMGHFAAGHLTWNFFLWPFMLMPWLGAAYLRAREYTADRCGFAVVGDLEASMRGLVVLAAGGKHAARADLKAFMDQRRETGRFWSAVLELVSSHPYLCKRVAALQEMHQPGTVQPIPRNVFAYPLAPVFGFAAMGTGGGAAGLLVVVAMVGIIAAIAIPSLLRARVSANESATLDDVRSVISSQRTYAEASGGTFGRLDCLTGPDPCADGYRGPALLTPEQAATQKSGYRRTLYLSPDASSFAYVAVPLAPGQTGIRGFCGDGRGMVCFTADGSAPPFEEGGCDQRSCTLLE